MPQPHTDAPSLSALQARIDYAERVKTVTNRIHAASNLDELLVSLSRDILGLFEAEHLTLYAVDRATNELYSRFLDIDRIHEIRVPIGNRSIAGYVAHNKQAVNIADAYDAPELRRLSPHISFDRSWDKKTGVRTRQLLTVPVCDTTDSLTGVMQLVNKKGAARFTPADQEKVREIAATLGIALHNQYQLAARHTKFEALLAARHITPQQLDEARAAARDTGASIESMLIERFGVPKRALGQALSAFYQCPFLEADRDLDIAPDLLRGINPSYLQANYWLPLRATDDTVEVLTDDPRDFQKQQDVRRLFPGKKIAYVVGLREDIGKLVELVSTDLASDASRTAILGQLVAEDQDETDPSPEAEADENDSAIVRLVNQVISDAYKAGVSDIHIEPQGERQETLIRFREDGNCYTHLRLPSRNRRAITSRVKVLAQLDIAERRKPQDGKIKFRLDQHDIELRVATIPTAGTGNEDVVLRLLTAHEPLPLAQLKMSDDNLRAFTQLLRKPYGMLLCVGPTGSGKTTTLHAALESLNTPEKKIWTAEDPVEISQAGLRQVHVNPKIGFDFAAALRSFLRADPDIIMVGEIRDPETAGISVQASLTGHLVLSTLHTNSAVETVTRLLEMQLDPFNFADALLGVLAQRLARTVCAGCQEPYRPSKEEYETLAHAYGEAAFARLNIPYDDDFRLVRGVGCQACRRTGYKGRVALHELLVVTDEIKSLILTRAPASELLTTARRQGLTTLIQDGVLKCMQGLTDYKQVQAVAMR